MTTEKLTHYLRYALKAVLYLILLTPLLVFSKFLFPFITSKTMYFRLLLEIALLLYGWLILLDKRYRPQMNIISWLVVIFGGIVLITGIFGVNFYKTFWGTIERGEGFLTLVHVIVYFLLLTWLFKEKKEWLNYLSGAVVVGGLVAGYGVLQKFNVQKFLFWEIINPGAGRLAATIGNAAFLGAFALQMFYFSMLLFFERRNLFAKLFFAFSALLQLFIIYNTQTRGAVLAWIIGAGLLSLLFIFNKETKEKNKLRWSAIGILVVIIIISVSVWFNRNATWVQNQSTLRRLVGISATDVTTQSRLLAWDTSWKGWKDRFFVGYGWENYNVAFNKYFHPEIFVDQGSQLWFDRAHNTIFDVAVATGVFGLLTYLMLFFFALKKLWQLREQEFYLTRVLGVALVAHFVQNIFVFDVLSTFLMLFIMLALAVFITEKQGEKSLLQNQIKNVDEINWIGALSMVLVFIIVAYIFNLKPMQANTKAIEGLGLVNAGKEQSAIDLFKQAIDMNTYQTSEIRQKLADNVILSNNTSSGLDNTQVINNFNLAIDEVKANIKAAPKDVQNYLYLMALLNRSAGFDTTRLEQVINWGEKALPLSPTRPQIYFEMGQARIGQKRFDDGIVYFQKAVDLNPKTMESRWNLMAAYAVAGRDTEAGAQYDFMAKNGYNFSSPENLERLYRVYMVAGKKEAVAAVLEKLTFLQPTADNYAKLATIYREIGQKEKARQAVKKAVELNPALQAEAEKFLQLLEN